MAEGGGEASISTVVTDSSDAIPGEDYWLKACGKRYPLHPHTAETRAAARAASPAALAPMTDAQLTHYSDPAELPDSKVVRVHLQHTLRTMGEPDVTGVGHVGQLGSATQ